MSGSVIPVPHLIQRRGWEAAFVLAEEFRDRLTLHQLVRMVVLTMMAPERLGWAEVGDSLATYASVVEVRV